jgi:hypothetical protein
MALHKLLFFALALLLAAVLAACSSDDDGSGNETPSAPTATPTPVTSERTVTPEPTSTPEDTPTPAPSPTPTPDPNRPLAENEAIIVGTDIRVRAQPTTQSEARRTLQDGERIEFKGIVEGENWITGNQTWGVVYQEWHDKWYELEDGGFVYSAFIYRPNLLEVAPWELKDETGERWIDVNTSTQTLTAHVGDRQVFSALVSTGGGAYPTPPGSWVIYNRVENELMTSEQAGYGPEVEPYRVENVLYTQYFTGASDALHLNYWRPVSYFGTTPSSHGCVGLWIHDAQWLWMFTDGHDVRVDVHG